MTPQKRDAYLQRNREYKGRRKNHDACTNGVQSAVRPTDKITDGNMHTTVLDNRCKGVAAAGSLNVSTSDKILRENMVSQVTRSQIMINPCDISTSCNNLTSTAPKMQEYAAVQEHEDHDSIIYVPKGPFPAIEGSKVYHLFLYACGVLHLIHPFFLS